MSVLTAIGILVLVLVVIDLVLTIGIIRRLRASGVDSTANESVPRVGLRVDLTKDAERWPADALGLVSGVSLAVLVLPGCPGCDRLHREIDAAGAVEVPLYLIGDPQADDSAEYLASWQVADVRIIAPVPLHELDSFERPDAFPAIMLLHDGVVVAGGYQLADVAQAIRDLLPGVAAQRIAT